MTTSPLGVQLYTLREALIQDFPGVIGRLAEIGYVGVEPFGIPMGNASKAAQVIKAAGLQVPSIHAALPLGEHRHAVLDEAGTYGCQYIVSGRGPESFKTLDLVKESCDLFNEAAAAASSAGLTFAMHNHWWEYERLDGRYVYEIMLELLDPAVKFEIDVYWVQTAGPDPAAIVRQLGQRAPLLHIKDGPAGQPDQPMTAVGEGAVDVPAVVRAGAGSSEWLIVELDRCATDMMEAVAKSYAYLTGEGLAHGRQG